MKQFFKSFFASLLAIIVASAILIGVIIGIAISAGSSEKSEETAKLKKSPILVIDLSNRIAELSSENSNKYSMLLDGRDYTPGLYDALHAIRYAAKDNDIKAIYLKLEGCSEGWGTAQQIREALADFKKSGKKIYAYGETISQKDYYIGSIANTIYLNPTGMLWFKGLASQMTFFKGTFDKLGVEPEIFYAGRFKSFTEPFRSDRMSEPNRAQIAAIQDAIWTEMLNAVREKTGTDTATINGWVQTGAIQFPTQAEQYKLVDGLKYRDEFEALIRKEQNLKEDPKEEDPLPAIAFDKYAAHARDKAESSKNRIALLFAEGDIIDGEGTDEQIASEDFVRTLRKIRADDKVKAVVLRINSGGGSALASEVMLRELQLFKEKKIPLIVSMGDVAASGGYYMSCGADSIFAMPNTITGSIGVFTMLFNLSGVANDKLGITFDVQKNAPYADFPTTSRSATPDEARRTQAGVDTIYATFLRRVAAGRRLTIAQVDSIAQGRVWSGTAALQNGLVDGLGGMDRALASAAAMAGVKEYEVKTFPEPSEALIKKIRRQLGNSVKANAAIKQALETLSGPELEALQQLQYLRQSSGKVQAKMPFGFRVD